MKSEQTNIITSIGNALEKICGALPKPSHNLPVIDILILSLLKTGETAENAELAYQDLCREFVDWNEVRVSQPREIYEVLAKNIHYQAYEKAHYLRENLLQIFHLYNKMDLNFLWKKDFAEIEKFMLQFRAIGDSFIQDLLPYSCYQEFLISQNFLRVGKRIGLWEENINPETLKETLYKDWGEQLFFALHSLLYLHGKQVCIPKGYDCLSCAIAKYCQKGLQLLKDQKVLKKTKKIAPQDLTPKEEPKNKKEENSSIAEADDKFRVVREILRNKQRIKSEASVQREKESLKAAESKQNKQTKIPKRRRGVTETSPVNPLEENE